MLANIPSTKGKLGNVKNEAECLFLLVVPEVANDSDWVAPSFVKPKTKLNRVRLLIDFRNLNKQLK